MKTKNAVIILLCIILAAFALGAADAVSLVNPSVIDDAAAGSDRLVGVLITESIWICLTRTPIWTRISTSFSREKRSARQRRQSIRKIIRNARRQR